MDKIQIMTKKMMQRFDFSPNDMIKLLTREPAWYYDQLSYKPVSQLHQEI
jgi:catalase